MDELMMVAKMSPEEQDRYFAAMPPDGTSTLLVADLEKQPQTPERDAIIERAKGYYYDDFKSQIDGCPKITLRGDLLKAGYKDLAANVVDGKYD